MQKIRTALLSYGMSGKVFHAPFIENHPGFELVGSWERTQKKIKDDYPNTKSFESLDAVLSDKTIDLVIVNTPIDTHFEYAKQVLLAGKHALVEKAFTTTFAEAQELKLLAKAYLYQEKWQQCFDMCGEVMTSNQYSLMPDYADVWRQVGENGTESIFEVQATLQNGLQDYTNVQGPRGTPDLGWGFNTPSLSLTESYEAGDLRKAGTIMFIPSVLWDGFVVPATLNNPRYNYKAYQSSLKEDWDGNWNLDHDLIKRKRL